MIIILIDNKTNIDTYYNDYNDYIYNSASSNTVATTITFYMCLILTVFNNPTDLRQMILQ